MADIQYNSKEIVILGAGGLGREIHSWIQNDKNTTYRISGFRDDNFSSLDMYGLRDMLLGSLSSVEDRENVLIGIMDCDFKSSLFENLKKKNQIEICGYIHESVIVGIRSNFGEGVVLFPKVVISCDVEIGDATFINLGSQIGHDVRIGNCVSIMPNVDLGGGVVIEDNVFIGTGATILPGVKIPENSRIGAGSVVVKSIKKSGTFFGNPARKIF
ncbi:acetyltransferase [Sphingobacterium corticibacterium]|uniref:Acetyltransferase n=1 Tax=Sphingobacterium corticibacterium TaxID=2484746 RepID=A0A4Q6XG96_9SPHI|nr:acetyltransferase [Sphingobacterium corticibacterium]RZF58881.1 acetyltransferase [Sphingobacterium corticibacterium]